MAFPCWIPSPPAGRGALAGRGCSLGLHTGRLRRFRGSSAIQGIFSTSGDLWHFEGVPCEGRLRPCTPPPKRGCTPRCELFALGPFRQGSLLGRRMLLGTLQLAIQDGRVSAGLQSKPRGSLGAPELWEEREGEHRYPFKWKCPLEPRDRHLPHEQSLL